MSDPVRNDFRPIVAVVDNGLHIAFVKGPHGMPATVARAHLGAAYRRAVEQVGEDPVPGGVSLWRLTKRGLPPGFSECMDDKCDVLDLAEAATTLSPALVEGLTVALPSAPDTEERSVSRD